MPAKYLQMLGEERRPELHRQQAGCVTGILQAFDRRYPLAAHHSHNRLLPPGACFASPTSPSAIARFKDAIFFYLPFLFILLHRDFFNCLHFSVQSVDYQS